MKTAVSIPGPLFKAADEVARRAGLSRSELYAKALAEYVEKQRGDWVTEQMNRVCEKVDTSLDDFTRELQARSIPREEW
jgi:metal-responsive CopG/Arc/MetJ family transcriptional regulator